MISISVSQSNQVHRLRFDLGHYSNQTHLMLFNNFMTIKEKGNNNLSQVHVQSVLNNVDQKFTVCNMHEYRKESIITHPTHSLDTNFEWQSFDNKPLEPFPPSVKQNHPPRKFSGPYQL